MEPNTDKSLHVACLCAAWCRLCEAYAQVFDQAISALRPDCPGLQVHWIDIEDQAPLVGDLHVETFPTVVLLDSQHVLFAGVLTPQPGILERVLRSALADAARGLEIDPPPPDVLGFAVRLRQTAGT